MKQLHPVRDIVLKHLRQLLRVQGVKYSQAQSQRFHHLFPLRLLFVTTTATTATAHSFRALPRHLQQRLREPVQRHLQLHVQRVRLRRSSKPFKNRIRHRQTIYQRLSPSLTITTFDENRSTNLLH